MWVGVGSGEEVLLEVRWEGYGVDRPKAFGEVVEFRWERR